MPLPKRKPKGEEHFSVVAGVWYRTPLYADSHLALEDLGTALCGRPLDIDPMWWIDSGWEEATGLPWFLVVDQRKAGYCSACRKTLRDRESDPFAVTLRPAPTSLTDAELDRLRSGVRAERLQLISLARWVAREFDGKVLPRSAGDVGSVRRIHAGAGR